MLTAKLLLPSHERRCNKNWVTRTSPMTIKPSKKLPGSRNTKTRDRERGMPKYHTKLSMHRTSSDDDWELSPAQIKELKRRVRDTDDPMRYMLVSEFSRRFVLYYNISDDVFAMNEPSRGTLFKRRAAAEKVKTLLSSAVSIVKFSTKGKKLKRLSPIRPRWPITRPTKA